MFALVLLGPSVLSPVSSMVRIAAAVAVQGRPFADFFFFFFENYLGFSQEKAEFDASDSVCSQLRFMEIGFTIRIFLSVVEFAIHLIRKGIKWEYLGTDLFLSVSTLAKL